MERKAVEVNEKSKWVSEPRKRLYRVMEKSDDYERFEDQACGALARGKTVDAAKEGIGAADRSVGLTRDARLSRETRRRRASPRARRRADG